MILRITTNFVVKFARNTSMKEHIVVLGRIEVYCEQSLRMVTRARKARARKSSETNESRGEAGEKAGKEGGYKRE